MIKKEANPQEDFLALARLSLAGKPQDVQLFLTRAARRYRETDPETAEKIGGLLSNTPERSSALRREAIPVPVDNDSRLHLIRVEYPTNGTAAPILTPQVHKQISDLIRERQQLSRLVKAGLEPTRSALFVGPPGVGKTLSARWIASQLNLPLIILDLSAVMSSFLGRTGNNVRAVLDYAKKQDCVLLLDELDAIAKRRDDATEIGELKRLVTVLLQEIDEWPAASLLISATNHPELLDPAVWRRFDLVTQFPPPSNEYTSKAIKEFFGKETEMGAEWMDILSAVFVENNYSDIEKKITRIRRASALDDVPIEQEVEKYLHEKMLTLSHDKQIDLASRLCKIGSVSQRRISELTGISRDTMRKRSTKSAKKKKVSP